MALRKLSYCLRGICASLASFTDGDRNDPHLSIFEIAASDANSTSRSSGATVASSASSGCFVGIDIVFIISALFCHQRRLLIHRVHCAIAFRSALKMSDGLFNPPEVVPAGGGFWSFPSS
jgi:hypothetical protein